MVSVVSSFMGNPKKISKPSPKSFPKCTCLLLVFLKNFAIDVKFLILKSFYKYKPIYLSVNLNSRFSNILVCGIWSQFFMIQLISWRIALVGFGLPWLGFGFGCLFSKLCRIVNITYPRNEPLLSFTG